MARQSPEPAQNCTAAWACSENGSVLCSLCLASEDELCVLYYRLIQFSSVKSGDKIPCESVGTHYKSGPNSSHGAQERTLRMTAWIPLHRIVVEGMGSERPSGALLAGGAAIERSDGS